jgi:hypothetical protein
MEPGRSDPPRLMWEGVELPRVASGDYQAICTGFQGPEFVRSFRRWSLRVEFQLLAENALVSAFFNLGNDVRAPQIGRRSRFYAAWCIAYGETPRKGQQMALDVFTEPGLIFLVRVQDATKDSKDELKPEGLIYSRVTEILDAKRQR